MKKIIKKIFKIIFAPIRVILNAQDEIIDTFNNFKYVIKDENEKNK